MHRGLGQRLAHDAEVEKLPGAGPAHREPHRFARLAFEELHRLADADGIGQHVIDPHDLITGENTGARGRSVIAHGDDGEGVLLQ